MARQRPPRDIVEISGRRLEAGGGGHGGGAPDSSARTGRPWLAIRWVCCGAYSRVYRDPGAKEYLGRCPRCGRTARVKVGASGTRCRFFEAGHS